MDPAVDSLPVPTAPTARVVDEAGSLLATGGTFINDVVLGLVDLGRR